MTEHSEGALIHAFYAEKLRRRTVENATVRAGLDSIETMIESTREQTYTQMVKNSSLLKLLDLVRAVKGTKTGSSSHD